MAGTANRATSASLAALAVFLLGSGALAHADGGAKTRISLERLRHSGAAGEVRSSRPSCEPNRKVTLFRYDGYVSEKVKITSSNSGGRWRVRRDLESGKYFVKVDSAQGCRYDVSRNKRL